MFWHLKPLQNHCAQCVCMQKFVLQSVTDFLSVWWTNVVLSQSFTTLFLSHPNERTWLEGLGFWYLFPSVNTCCAIHSILLSLHLNEVLFCFFYGHNIIWNLNNILWDWQYFSEYSPHSAWMWGIFRRILSVRHNIVLDLNNVMGSLKAAWLCSIWSHRLETNFLPWWFRRKWFNQWQTGEKGANGLPWDLLLKKWLS